MSTEAERFMQIEELLLDLQCRIAILSPSASAYQIGLEFAAQLLDSAVQNAKTLAEATP